MAQSAVTATAPAAVAPISLSALAPWAVFAAVVTLVLLYFVGIEQGATAVFEGETVHEWLHDGRHLLGFPCH
ncbi:MULTISPECIES: CbtB domain-containing protein [unclassified Streptomyces]|uniref:CbtB domain-containing protein n=1 Tax=unclassified Streptomyces TaxID=2593676 RepID=UPI001BE6CA9E|nr:MULTISPECIES: CbtB domain-containing protein [unclassified Streptomyces]MBT2407973.1 CbtB-domain containing protein [Streptomyces sp. ISL-21]MBT2457671.1 CbtB-domain containing protein [Streptomyces sp. ISL-86]MBT2610532.1 CbtB-domain containing protein [Streptomyces sp. ISL-87]